MKPRDIVDADVQRSRREVEDAVGAIREVVEGRWGLTRDRQRWLLPLLVGATAFLLARQFRKD
ncbi:MAG: hypothetical protein AAF690_03745 [Acidobacteriota bacterium]